MLIYLNCILYSIVSSINPLEILNFQNITIFFLYKITRGFTSITTLTHKLIVNTCEHIVTTPTLARNNILD